MSAGECTCNVDNGYPCDVHHAYDALPAAVRAVVDGQAEDYARARGITLDEARELIAATVTTTTVRYGNGKGH